MDCFQSLLYNTQFPVLTAFLFGLAVAFHPCPLAANIAAMGYIVKDVTDRKRVLINGLLYTLGRVLAYSVLGFILVSVFRSGIYFLQLSEWFSHWGEKVLAPALIGVGLYFLLSRVLHRHEHCPEINSHKRRFHGAWGSLLLGVLLALTFCPESAIVYFGMLIPLSSQVSMGCFLPVVFGLATTVPTLLMVWGVAYGVIGSAVMRRRMHIVQRWINVFVAIVFIVAGVFCAIF